MKASFVSSKTHFNNLYNFDFLQCVTADGSNVHSNTDSFIQIKGMSGRHTLKADEGLMMMQELEDRLKEHTDKLEHIRLSATDLRDALSGNHDDMKPCISEHVDWLGQMTDRVETLQMNTAVFVQMNAKPRSFRGKQQGLRNSSRWGRSHVTDDVQSEYGWSPVHTRRNSDAASEMSCAW